MSVRLRIFCCCLFYKYFFLSFTNSLHPCIASSLPPFPCSFYLLQHFVHCTESFEDACVMQCDVHYLSWRKIDTRHKSCANGCRFHVAGGEPFCACACVAAAKNQPWRESCDTGCIFALQAMTLHSSKHTTHSPPSSNANGNNNNNNNNNNNPSTPSPGGSSQTTKRPPVPFVGTCVDNKADTADFFTSLTGYPATCAQAAERGLCKRTTGPNPHRTYLPLRALCPVSCGLCDPYAVDPIVHPRVPGESVEGGGEAGDDASGTSSSNPSDGGSVATPLTTTGAILLVLVVVGVFWRYRRRIRRRRGHVDFYTAVQPADSASGGGISSSSSETRRRLTTRMLQQLHPEEGDGDGGGGSYSCNGNLVVLDATRKPYGDESASAARNDVTMGQLVVRGRVGEVVGGGGGEGGGGVGSLGGGDGNFVEPEIMETPLDRLGASSNQKVTQVDSSFSQAAAVRHPLAPFPFSWRAKSETKPHEM